MFVLRPDQQKGLADIRQAYRDGAKAPLFVAPTGFGKTVVFSEICRGAARLGNGVMVLVHRQELIEQVTETLYEFEVSPGIISPQYEPNYAYAVQVASVYSVGRRLSHIRPPKLIIVDEAHHATASTWGKVIAAFPAARLLGVTATPARLSGEGLGDIFDRMVLGPTAGWLVAEGHLSTPRVFAPPTIDVSSVPTRMGDFAKGALGDVVNRPKVVGDAIEHYQRLTPGQRAIVFCVSLDHAAHMAGAARTAGITAVQIDGGMDRTLRREIVNDFKLGRIQWLVSVDLISEGFDCPGAEVGICLRPTQSLALWLQQCGRIMRKGKPFATILDHAGNALRHGLPTEERVWTLDGCRKSGGKKSSGVSVRVCPSCFSAQRSGRPSCGNCGHVFAVAARDLRKEQGILEELTPEQLEARRVRREQGQTQTLEQLTALGRMRGMNNPEGWARHVFDARKAKQQRKDELPEKPF